MYFLVKLKLLGMQKSKFHIIYLLIGTFFLSICAHASDFVDLNADTACKIQILHLNDNVERIQWLPPTLDKFKGHVIYDNQNVEIISGDNEGFCPLVKAQQKNAQNWLTYEERGGSSIIDGASEGAAINDSNGEASPGLANDLTTFFGDISKRSNEYKNDTLGRGYHLKRLYVLMNISGQIRWIDLPVGQVFMSRLRTVFPVPYEQKNGSWGQFLIEGNASKGPRVAVYGYYEGHLQLLASTPWHGDKDGWINLVGVRDFDRDKRPEIVAIRDPQTTGALEVWELQHKTAPSGTPYTLVKRDSKLGFSNHKFGTKSLQISTILEFSDPPKIIVPNLSKNVLQIMSIKNGKLKKLRTLSLPSKVTHDMAYINALRGKTLITKLIVPLSDNTVRFIPLTTRKLSIK